MAATGEERQVTWDELSTIVGQRVRVVMPDGARIEGRATKLEADALAVEISKTSNKPAYPKGRFLIPRATLKAVDVVERPTKRWRIVCVALGSGVAYVALRAAINLAKTSAAGGAGFGAVAAAMPVLGYLVGNAADRRVITYVIAP
ncbi:MAG: hypothetical protein ACLP59_34085 [Bryobacteraceae bacterium]